MNLEGLTQDDVAEWAGVSRPAVTHWFAVDDASLAVVQDFIESRGYSFNLWLTRDNVELDNNRRFPLSHFILVGREAADGLRPLRLTFLSVAMKRYDISMTEFAKRLGLTVSSVRYWFKQDSVSFSNLFWICTACDFSLHVNIKKMEVPTEGNRVFFASIGKEMSMPIKI